MPESVPAATLPELSHESARLATAIRDQLGGPLHALGVEGARAFVDERSAVDEPITGLPSADRSVTTRHGDVRVRIHRPSVSSDPRPVVLYLHGGGWVVGGLDQCDAWCRALAASSGAVVVAIDYPLAPEARFPIAVEACLDVLARVAAPEGIDGIQPTAVALAGDSAGGNLATVLAQLAGSEGLDIAAQALLYPVTDRGVSRPSWTAYGDSPLLGADDMAWFWQQYVGDEVVTDPRALPLRGRLTGLPPTLMQLAACDPLLDDGRAYASALEAAGVSVDRREYSGTFHGFAMQLGRLTAADRAVADMARFLIDTLP